MYLVSTCRRTHACEADAAEKWCYFVFTVAEDVSPFTVIFICIHTIRFRSVFILYDIVGQCAHTVTDT